jgi:lipopolysaccharide transport system ATP-binding protein
LIEISAGFHPDLTGRENLFLQGAIIGMRRAEIARKSDEIIDFAGIEEFIDTPVKRYSSGMNARLGFAIAAHVDPDVLLIDEVLAVGDFSFQQKCFKKLDDFKKAGVAVAFVSHNMQAVAALCDRALLLRRNQPALLTDVSDAIALYATAGTVASDDRVSDLKSELADETGSLVGGEPLVPGAVISISVEFLAQCSFPRCCIGFELVRSDGLLTFSGGSTLDGMPPRDVEAGTVVRARVQFRANVLRGTYVVNLSLADDKRLWPSVVLKGLGSFVVHETTRVGGCAELQPQYEMTCLAAPQAQGNGKHPRLPALQ